MPSSVGDGNEIAVAVGVARPSSVGDGSRSGRGGAEGGVASGMEPRSFGCCGPAACVARTGGNVRGGALCQPLPTGAVAGNGLPANCRGIGGAGGGANCPGYGGVGR